MNGLIGKTVGSYRILEQIGEGGMATVYKAYQPALNRDVAVKILPPQLSKEPGFAKRFQREARAVAQLEHPHILPVHDYGQDNDLSYIVMRYVDGGTLKQLMKQPLELRKITDLIEQIAEALDYAHKKGFVHRDVKPSNVLLDQEGRILLADFGLARMLEASQQITATGVGIGTPDYMSPEQGLGERVDHRTDIYSLGVVLYEMLTGRVPYHAETPMAVVLKHINDPLPLPASINPEIPENVERIVLKAMAKVTEDRFSSAGELAKALRDAVRAVKTTFKDSLEVKDKDIEQQERPIKKPKTKSRELKTLLLIALPIFAIAAVAITLRHIPLRLQITGGQVEVVKLATPTSNTHAEDVTTMVPTVTPSPTMSTTQTPVEPTLVIIPTSTSPEEGLNGVWFVGFNTSLPPFDDLLVRKAFAYATNRQVIVDILNQQKPDHTYTATTSLTPPNILGVDLNEKIGFPYNPDTASKLLAEAGYPDGDGFPTITFAFPRGNHQHTAELLRDQWEQVLDVHVEIYMSSYTDVLDDPPQLFTYGWGADYADPHHFLYDPICGEANWEFWESDESIQLAETIEHSTDIQSKREAMAEYSRQSCLDSWNPNFQWDNSTYKEFLDEALWEEDEHTRREMYVEAEKLLVQTDAIIIPLFHLHYPSEEIQDTATPSPTSLNLTPTGAGTGLPTPAGKLLYSDDFESGLAHGFEFYQGNWKVVDDGTGNKVLEATPSRGRSNSSFGPNNFSDGIIEFRFRVTSGEGLMQFNFRNQAININGEWTTYIVVYERSTHALRLVYQEKSAPWQPVEATSGGGSIQNPIGDWINLRIEVQGQDITVFVNGNHFITAYDSRNPQGGLYIGSSAGNLIVHFDDIKVWDISSE